FSTGSRGSRTFSAPAPTRTAPSVAPLNRSVTQPARPGLNNPAQSPGFFGGGFGRGLLGGFLGAGLLGLLFGHGLFGGLGGFASILGLILQVGLVVLIGRFLWSMWQRRQPAFASGGPTLRDAGGMGSGPGNGLGSGLGFGGNSTGMAGQPVDVTQSDYGAFER